MITIITTFTLSDSYSNGSVVGGLVLGDSVSQWKGGW